MAIMPLNHVFRKYTGGYNIHKLQEKINHLMYMDGIKVFAKNEKELETGSEDIQSRWRDGIWH